MKVMHITNAYPYPEYESFGIFIKEQIASLEEIGIENKVFFINARKEGSKEYFKCKTAIKTILDDYEPDIIHCHHEFSLIPLLFLKTNKPIVLSLLGDLQNRSIVNKLFFKLVKKKVHSIILKNKKKSAPAYYYIPNGVNLDFFKPTEKVEAKKYLGLNQDKKYILFVTAALDNPIKRYDKFQAILKELHKKDERFEELIMTGVSRDIVPLYFSAGEFLLLTSDHEGSPNAVKEAMACNLAVVSTDVGNVKHLFGNSNGHFLSTSGTVQNLFALTLKASQIRESEGRKRLVELELDMNSIAGKINETYEYIFRQSQGPFKRNT